MRCYKLRKRRILFCGNGNSAEILKDLNKDYEIYMIEDMNLKLFLVYVLIQQYLYQSLRNILIYSVFLMKLQLIQL